MFGLYRVRYQRGIQRSPETWGIRATDTWTVREPDDSHWAGALYRDSGEALLFKASLNEWFGVLPLPGLD